MPLSGATAAEPGPVAIVNLDRIFKTHKPFQDQLEPLKAAAKELEQTLQVRQAELETVGTQLRRSQPGSPEFQRLQVQFVKLQTELQQFIAAERQNLQKKEADVHLRFYREIDAQIRKYAKEHGITLVLRQIDYSLEDNQPVAEVLKALNRSILYDDSLDITDEILKALAAPSVAGTPKGAER